MTLARLGTRSLRATPYPAIQLLQDRLAVLGTLLVIANLPKLFGGKSIQTRGNIRNVELVVALYGELGVLKALLGVGNGDVPKLRVGAHDLLGRLLEGLLLLLSLLLEGLLLLLGLLHPLLGRLLEGLLLLLGLAREVGTGGVQELHVGIHQLLDHPLGVLLLLLDLFGQGLHRAEPLRPRTLRPVIHPTVSRAPIHHVISSPNVASRIPCVPVQGAFQPRPLRRIGFSQERGIGVARLSESPSSEARMIAECALCTRLSSEGIHSSIASSIAAVLTTSWLASTSSLKRFCCSRAVSSSIGLTQLKEAQTVLPSPPSSSMSSPSWSARVPPRGSSSALMSSLPSRFRRLASRPFSSKSESSSSSECSSPA